LPAEAKSASILRRGIRSVAGIIELNFARFEGKLRKKRFFPVFPVPMRGKIRYQKQDIVFGKFRSVEPDAARVESKGGVGAPNKLKSIPADREGRYRRFCRFLGERHESHA
jgi:hypothetical protein